MTETTRKMEYLPVVLILLLAIAPSSTHAQNSAQDFIDAHNAARTEVGVGPVKWNNTVVTYALDYAKHRSTDCELIHSEGPYGENIYVGYGEGYSLGTDAVRWWYDEKPFYEYDSNTCSTGKDCLHYTQMVWRDSTSIGCARVECSNNKGWFFITCNYDPPGNYWGERPY